MNTDEVQLELFVDFSSIVNKDTILVDIDVDNNELIIRMELNPQFQDIGSYLLDQCFCHTEQRPLITFRYNDNYPDYVSMIYLKRRSNLIISMFI